MSNLKGILQPLVLICMETIIILFFTDCPVKRTYCLMEH